MIQTVGELKALLAEYEDGDSVIVTSGGGAAAIQHFQIESVGFNLCDSNSVHLTLSEELQ